MPFNDEEARELIEKPLRYLGLYFSQDSESLIFSILDRTNYYPCLIQFYCESLLKEMCKDDYAYYIEDEVPVYYVKEEHIKKVLFAKGFDDTMEAKFTATLDLNPTYSKSDHTYKYLAYILAFLCHNEGYGSYGISDFVKVAEEKRIKHICMLRDQNKLELYMNHLVELSVFSCEKEKYSFRRLPLWLLLGNEDKVKSKISSFAND